VAWLDSYKAKDGTKHFRVRDRVKKKPVTVVKDAGVFRETAKEIKRQYEDNLARQSAGISTPSRSISVAIETWASTPKNPKTRDTYRESLRALMRFCQMEKLGDLTGDVIDAWRIAMQNGTFMYTRGGKNSDGTPKMIRYTPPGISIKLRTLRTFCEYCVERGWLSISPFKGIKIGRDISPKRFLRRNEAAQLLRACGTRELRKLVLFGLYTGMRAGEVLRARWDHLDENWVLFIPHAKKHLQRSVPIPPNMQRILGKRSSRRSGSIFHGWSVNRLGTARQRAVARSGLGRVRFHDLRHSFARSYFKSRAGDHGQLRDVMGHRDMASLETYAHFDTEDLTQGMKKFRLQ
jgi:Site-specific recombinase XerC